MRYCFLLALIHISLTVSAQRSISFTFDDGSSADRPGYSNAAWNQMLLDNLDSAGVKAVLFATGRNLSNPKGEHILETWNAAGHRIANHTWSHPNYSRESTSYEMFAREFLKNDSVVRQYSQFLPLFRFPYLKEGKGREKVEQFRSLLAEHGYQNGYVTIDASDWYISSRLVKRLRKDPGADISGFRDYYLEHLYERAVYYDDLAFELTGRRIKHTLLLHHNLAAALFLDDLIAMFAEKGWQIIDADEAFEDPVFDTIPDAEFAGESLIWSMAKENGTLDADLRYPAEDSQYEKEKMDARGL